VILVAAAVAERKAGECVVASAVVAAAVIAAAASAHPRAVAAFPNQGSVSPLLMLMVIETISQSHLDYGKWTDLGFV
jgi:hypothetical protein